MTHAETAADPERLVAALPAAPEGWERDDAGGGIVEYRLPDTESPCHAAKLTVRPDPLSEAAVRVDRTRGCSSAGTTRHDDVTAAVAAVRAALDA
ncbi:hypothetical protein BRD13_00065 [Halobacteriales archaeon SW_5_70_135]|nr:MAG: hypothetical protein BRD13_00065 [Halobacteriales archaeon SW_5_70_135]